VSARLREWNDGWLGEALNLVEPVELFTVGKKVGLDPLLARIDERHPGLNDMLDLADGDRGV